MKQVTIKYNIGITIVYLLYRLKDYLVTPAEGPILLDPVFEQSPLGAFAVIFAIMFVAIPVFMYSVRSLWNRIFPQLCGWKEIGLAESYALGIIAAFLFGG